MKFRLNNSDSLKVISKPGHIFFVARRKEGVRSFIRMSGFLRDLKMFSVRVYKVWDDSFNFKTVLLESGSKIR